MATPLSLSMASTFSKPLSSQLLFQRNLKLPVISALSSPYGESSTMGLYSKTHRLPLKLDRSDFRSVPDRSYGVIEAKNTNPPIMPAVMTPGGPLDLSAMMFRNRIIFVGKQITSEVAHEVISQLVTLATIDENADIMLYINCPGGNPYSVLAIYDCMSWIKPKVGTVCFGTAASQAAFLLAGGEKGMRYAMPNARIMIHQPLSGSGGHAVDTKRQALEAVHSRNKLDKMFAAFTGQPLEKVQQFTERDCYISACQAMDFGLIDGILETRY